MKILHGNNIDHLKDLEDNSVDSLVTDPPYLINFMGKEWDKENSPAGNADFWKEVMRVLKPGAHGLVFGHSRQHHRVMVALEDAGFEIRDCLMWMYGSGFPKSHNIGKAIEKLTGTAKVKGKKKGAGTTGNTYVSNNTDYVGGDKGVYKKEYDEIEITNKWEGWGTALKPAYEPIILVRKPLEKKLSVSKNVMEWGTGGLNIDASRIDYQSDNDRSGWHKSGADGSKGYLESDTYKIRKMSAEEIQERTSEGRWPANVLFSHHEECRQIGSRTETTKNHNAPKGTFAGGEQDRGSETVYREQTNTIPVWACADGCPVKELDSQSGTTKSSKRGSKYNKETENRSGYTPKESDYRDDNTYSDSGGASRFFYCAKVGKKERNAGLEDFEDKEVCYGYKTDSEAVKSRDVKGDIGLNKVKIRKNTHPTVKPIALMTYLVKLITPPSGIVLDPFMGSGSTGIACVKEGFDFIGMEMEEEYVEIAKARIEHHKEEPLQTIDK